MRWAAIAPARPYKVATDLPTRTRGIETPPTWWRLLYEYRADVATDPAASAELFDLDRRCREIIAGHIERFAASVGQVLPISGMELAELTGMQR